MSKRLLSGDDDMDMDNCVPEEVEEMAAAAMDMERGLFMAAVVLTMCAGCRFPRDVERMDGGRAEGTSGTSIGRHILLLRPENRDAEGVP
jgi:hypothetical protein